MLHLKLVVTIKLALSHRRDTHYPVSAPKRNGDTTERLPGERSSNTQIYAVVPHQHLWREDLRSRERRGLTPHYQSLKKRIQRLLRLSKQLENF